MRALAGRRTLQDLLSKENADDLWDVVSLFPPNTVRLDGMFFLRVCPSSTGRLRYGYVMVLVQSKTRGATALPDVNIATIFEKPHALEPKLVDLIGGQERYDYWLARSCYMHVVDGEVTQSDKKVGAGSWSERAIIRTRDDLPFLFGRMLFSAGRIIGLVDEALILQDHDSSLVAASSLSPCLRRQENYLPGYRCHATLHLPLAPLGAPVRQQQWLPRRPHVWRRRQLRRRGVFPLPPPGGANGRRRRCRQVPPPSSYCSFRRGCSRSSTTAHRRPGGGSRPWQGDGHPKRPWQGWQRQREAVEGAAVAVAGVVTRQQRARQQRAR